MGLPKRSNPVKLFVGMLAQGRTEFDLAAKSLSAAFGPIDLESIPRPWNYTQYYARELGDRLVRKFVFFQKLITPHALGNIKQATIDLEQNTGRLKAGRFCRSVNLDPGYLTESKVVLATTKDYAHRVCIQEGIYAEVTLIYKDGGFGPAAYTYPDYQTEEYLELFDQVRDILRRSCQSLP